MYKLYKEYIHVHVKLFHYCMAYMKFSLNSLGIKQVGQQNFLVIKKFDRGYNINEVNFTIIQI